MPIATDQNARFGVSSPPRMRAHARATFCFTASRATRTDYDRRAPRAIMSSVTVMHTPPRERPTSWWLAMLRKRAERMDEEKLDLSEPIAWESEEERLAAIKFFNAAYRAEESGLAQAHALAEELRASDPELAECLVLYGNEEGWHRELLVQFLGYLGGGVRPMGRVTSTFYRLYGRAERMDTIVLTNLMFETIGSTTYRLALRRARHPAVRQMLTILTRDESFHVPLNVHFLRRVLARTPGDHARRARLYHLLYVALLASAAASRRRAERFDRIPFGVLARAYGEQLGRLFMQEPDLGLVPSRIVLGALGLRRAELAHGDGPSVVSAEAAEAAADRSRVVVTAL
jgi:hypothetical protein